MGCDIHFVVEQPASREPGSRWVGMFGTDAPFGPAWEHRQHIPMWTFKYRNYAFFNRLAAVRGPGPEAKGMPDDASDMARMFASYWGGDGHSHSYCSLREFVEAYLTCEPDTLAKYTAAKLAGNERELLCKACGLDEFSGNEDAVDVLDWFRVVFWFDN